MKQKIRFIINPISGRNSKEQIPELIDTYLDHERFDYDIRYTQHRFHAKELTAEAVGEGIDIVCAVGGDGSVHEVGTSLTHSNTALAIIPRGSGNGFANHLQIPSDVQGALRVINRCHRKKIDTVLANDKPFINVGGYGFDAVVAKKFDEAETRGMRTYVRLVIKYFKRYKNLPLEIQVNNTTIKDRFFLCTIANGSEFGNKFKISPTSSMSDGLLELILVRKLTFLQGLRIGRKFFAGKSHQSKWVETIQFTEATIKLTKPISHYDGEPFKVRQEIHVKIVPQSLNVISGQEM